jgi:hypothetical protein
MRKYENVDVVAMLGAVVELNTAHYKSDFKYDIAMFKEAAQHPDGENNRFLWLSRPSGTYCFPERDVYVKDTAAFNYWNGSATILGKDTPFDRVIVNDRVMTYAVEVTGAEHGRIMGNVHEINYPEHIRQLNRVALPKDTIAAKFADGTEVRLPHAEYDRQRERLCHQQGEVKEYRADPRSPDALRIVVSQERQQREKDAQPAAFKVRVKNPPSIKQKIAAGKQELATARSAAPARAAAKTNAMEV